MAQITVAHTLSIAGPNVSSFTGVGEYGPVDQCVIRLDDTDDARVSHIIRILEAYMQIPNPKSVSIWTTESRADAVQKAIAPNGQVVMSEGHLYFDQGKDKVSPGDRICLKFHHCLTNRTLAESGCGVVYDFPGDFFDPWNPEASKRASHIWCLALPPM